MPFRVNLGYLVAETRLDLSGFRQGVQTLKVEIPGLQKAFEDAVETPAQKAAREAEKAAARVRKAFKTLHAEMIGIGKGMTAAITLPLVGVAVQVVKTAKEYDSLSKATISLTGDTKEAARQLKELREAAKLPGVGFEEAIRASNRLQAVGVGFKQAKEMVVEFGNALMLAGGQKEQLNGVFYALSQIQGKGKVFAEEVRQIQEHVPAINKAIQMAFGTQNTEAIQEAGITAKEFFEGVTIAMQRMPRAADGAQNAMDNFNDVVKDGLREIGQTLLPMVIDGMKFLQREIISLTDWWKGLDRSTKEWIIYTIAAFAVGGPLLLAIGGVISAVKTIGTTFVALKTTIGTFSTWLTTASIGMGGAIAAGVGVAALAIAGLYLDWRRRHAEMQQEVNATRQGAEAQQALVASRRPLSQLGRQLAQEQRIQERYRTALSAWHRDYGGGIYGSRDEMEAAAASRPPKPQDPNSATVRMLQRAIRLNLEREREAERQAAENRRLADMQARVNAAGAGRAKVGPQLPPQVQALVDAAAGRHGLNVNILRALAWQESRGRQGARSPVGAVGVMQLMPDTARGLGVNPFDMAQNIEGGARYLKQQLNRFGGNYTNALAAYNAGPGAVQKYGGVPPFAETQNYVKNILSMSGAAGNRAVYNAEQDAARRVKEAQEKAAKLAAEIAENLARITEDIKAIGLEGFAKEWNDIQQNFNRDYRNAKSPAERAALALRFAAGAADINERQATANRQARRLAVGFPGISAGGMFDAFNARKVEELGARVNEGFGSGQIGLSGSLVNAFRSAKIMRDVEAERVKATAKANQEALKLQDEYDEILARQQEERDRRRVRSLANIFAGVRDVLENTFFDVLEDGFDNLFSNIWRGFKNLVNRLVAEWLTRMAITGIVNLFTGGGGVASGIFRALGFDSGENDRRAKTYGFDWMKHFGEGVGQYQTQRLGLHSAVTGRAALAGGGDMPIVINIPGDNHFHYKTDEVEFSNRVARTIRDALQGNRRGTGS